MTQQAYVADRGSAGRTALAIFAGVFIVLACFAPLYVIVFTLNERRAPVLGTPTAEQNIPAEPTDAPRGTVGPPALRQPLPSVVSRPPPAPAVTNPAPPAATVPPVATPAPPPPAQPAEPPPGTAPQAAAPQPPPTTPAPGQPAGPGAANNSGMPFVRSFLPWLF